MNGPTETPEQATRRLAALAINDGYKPEALHEYTDQNGKPLHWRIRLKHPDTKDKWIRPMRLNGVGFELGEPEYPDGKPLYRLRDLTTRPGDPVIVCEGEWCADALVKAGALATTSGSADSAAKADWRPLAGRDMIIWPDNDEAGGRYADAVADAVLALGCTVRLIDVAALDLPPKGDAADWLAAHPDAAAADVAALPCLEAEQRTDPGADRATGSDPEGPEWRAAVERLAKLSPMEYDRGREEEARALKVRVTTLDAEVEKARRAANGTAEEAHGSAVMFEAIEPYPEPVDGADLLSELAATARRYAILPEHADVALALWIVFAHCIDAVSIAPILALTSPEKRCGKSTVLALLGRLVLRPLPSANITAAPLFRAVEAWAPTLLIDEADTFIRNSDELRGILNSGHTRELAYVIRTVGDDHEPRKFSTWGAKAIALIGKLKDTLADRSIEIRLKRKLLGERVERLRHADQELFRTLARRCARFAADHNEAIRAARPAMPEALHDRAADNWEPLLAIAELAGGGWPDRASAAALALSGSEDAEGDSLRVQLLTDVRDIFEDRSTDRTSSENLTAALVDLEERPWAEYSRGKPLTKAKLARLLRPFRVVSGTIRLPDGKTLKGYHLQQFSDAFARYLPTKAQQRHNVGVARVSEDFESVTAGGCGVSENTLEASCGAGCDVVTDKNTPSWETRI